jgi:cell division protein FtsI/penicillin-binding protein 2
LIRLKEPLRRFEYDSLGAQVLGCTDVDNNGLSGVELFFDNELRGRAGMMVMQRDALGRRHHDIDLPQTPPEHGSGLVLTVDVNIQGIVEDELSRGVRVAGAVSGTAIAVEPASGEILAMASYPGFDPNQVRSAEPASIRVRAITDSYEPGSTMKAITAAAAIEEEVVDAEEALDGEGGAIMVGTHVIRDDHPLPRMTFRQALEHSSNIAFARVAARLTEPRFYKYVRDFGFGIATGIDLPGEARGEVRKPAQFVKGTQQFMAFGYQLAVTPLQLVCAYAALANGGVMMRPHLLKRRLGREGDVVEEVEPQQIRRVVSEETAAIVRDMLIGTVERGTGQAARIPGLKIAGKTGTAQQIADGSYSKEKYNASFIGFFPAEDPKVALLVLLDSPTNGYYGGQVAAPIFREIARRVVNASMHGSEPVALAPSTSTAQAVAFVTSDRVVVPDLRGLDIDAAQTIAERYGFRVMAQGSGRVIVAQAPAPGSAAPRRGVVTLNASRSFPAQRMPDVRGLSLRRAINLLNASRIRLRVSGAGRVSAQKPDPGAVVDPGRTTALLQCRD